MARTINVIRLVGGPPKLDGSLCDLRLSARDRADAEGSQFVRAVHGSTVTALAGLQSRCTDRRSADELATSWRALVYRANPGRPRTGWRPLVYHFQGHYSLEARRDARGRWGLAVCAKLAGAEMPLPPPTTTVWSSLEAAVDEAAGRFASVAGLVPAGLHAHRMMAAHDAVATCVADAARLCAVGAAIMPSNADSIGQDRRAALVSRIGSLVHTIDCATASLVDLHLELRDAIDPITPVAPLARSWAELE
jgi:hypothetical protein